ncbi:tRNA lysidine(34) synthetase TilS [Candidatus Riesia pediculischaeffi]|uniref:tRNA(Ile)-lysidine synthase n=1 Tax=Candidatus Riesia pediculischaeffi PTSU TaxID=1401651 RepID=A0A0C1S9S3_9ENTR|nr:tRNA lysidine(34) synthetase TilS [Candidatus Riesia pediculischaeffi]KIE64041.1 tRNA(Ile)-lysidine synthetase [Candidatus Riesia pediculischaeffi PTSU]
MKCPKDRPYDLIKKVYKILQPFQKMLIGFSGGLDSTVLLHILTKIRRLRRTNMELRAIHINHNLQKKSKLWEFHCKKICELWKVKFLSRNVIVRSNDGGTESASRAVRYKEIRRVLLPREVVLVAHHIDDQAETFFLSLKRGSGPSGLSCMRFITPFYDTKIIRPFLSFEKRQLKRYAEMNNLSWIDDESNFKDIFDRNFLRIHVVPILNDRWPYFTSSIFKSAELCRKQEELVSELIEPYFLNVLDHKDGTLKIKKLLNFSTVKRDAVIRRWFKFHNLSNPSQRQLHALWNNVICTKRDSQPELIVSNRHVIRKFQDSLFCCQKFIEFDEDDLIWNLSDDITLPGDLGRLTVSYGRRMYSQKEGVINRVRKPRVDEIVFIRFKIKRKKKVRVVGQKNRSMKEIWKQHKVAPWMRRRIPLIFYDSKLITMLDYFVTEEGDVSPSVENDQIYIRWIK